MTRKLDLRVDCPCIRLGDSNDPGNVWGKNPLRWYLMASSRLGIPVDNFCLTSTPQSSWLAKAAFSCQHWVLGGSSSPWLALDIDKSFLDGSVPCDLVKREIAAA